MKKTGVLIFLLLVSAVSFSQVIYIGKYENNIEDTSKHRIAYSTYLNNPLYVKTPADLDLTYFKKTYQTHNQPAVKLSPTCKTLLLAANILASASTGSFYMPTLPVYYLTSRNILIKPSSLNYSITHMPGSNQQLRYVIGK